MTRFVPILKVVLPLVLIAAGIASFKMLVATRAEATRTERSTPGALVEVVHVTPATHEVSVSVQGSVIPAQRIIVSPELGGRVTWQSDELMPGGRLARGAPLLRIDARNFRLAVESRHADVNRAQLELEIEQGRQVVAQREWETFSAEDGEEGGGDEAGRALALREPQVRTATVGLRAARSAVSRARLDLSRTRITAPFNALVVSETVDLGQVVGPNAQLATLVGTDRFWVQVSIPVEQLTTLAIPGHGAVEGSSARVVQRIGSEEIVRDGRIVRLLADLDPVGSMARLLVEIDDPLGLAPDAEAGLPMLLGAYVNVELDARTIEGAIELPRRALREGSRVWVLTPDGELDIRDVSIVWSKPDSVLIGGGIADGDAIIVSRLQTPVSGMALRTADQTPSSDEPAGQP